MSSPFRVVIQPRHTRPRVNPVNPVFYLVLLEIPSLNYRRKVPFRNYNEAEFCFRSLCNFFADTANIYLVNPGEEAPF